MNVLNIALLARVFVFFAYPTEISGDICWVAYDYNWMHQLLGFEAGTLEALGMSALPEGMSWKDYVWSHIPDGWTGATPLGLAAKGGWDAVLASPQYTTTNMFWGAIPGSIGETCKPLILAGAALLISWMGSFFFAMAFMATDPVTASATNTGKWIYGFFIGSIGMIIRVLNPAYPEGWMLAILFMNVFAPLIDHYVLQSNISKRLKRITSAQ